MGREITYAQAILEATDQCMDADPSVYIMGLGVPDPKGIFGTTLGLKDKYGDRRVMDMPVSENAMTGVAIGSAIRGMRPILTHQRVDFMLLSLDQLINNAAKWHYMFDGKMRVPMVIRIIIGRGWGQGPQHSQSLQALFAHIPGLKVVMPSTPYDSKGLLVSSIEDDNPVIFLEHRWLHHIFGEVPEEIFRVPLGKANVLQEGKDVTVVSTSHMALESFRAVKFLRNKGVEAEVIDLRTIKPLDEETILNSVRKTGRLVVVDGDWKFLGLSAEIIAMVTEKVFNHLKAPPCRVAFPDIPTPTSRVLSDEFYPGVINIINAVTGLLNLPDVDEVELGLGQDVPKDIPDKSFTGPF
jgi:acetoin:2,6-dichlorophenolindophenol oxidoreductase subunit beta